MIRKTICLIMLLFIFMANLLNAASQKRSAIVEVTGYTFFSEDMSIKEIRKQAITNAKREALERGDSYIKSITKVKNMMLTYDLVELKSEGLIRILDSEDLGFTDDNRYAYRIKAELNYVLNIPKKSSLNNNKSDRKKEKKKKEKVHAKADSEKVAIHEKEDEKPSDKSDTDNQDHIKSDTVETIYAVDGNSDTTAVQQVIYTPDVATPEDNVEKLIQSNPHAPLTVSLWTNQKNYQNGEVVQIYLKGNKEFYGRIVYIDVDKNIIQLLPNLYRKSNLFKANTTYTFPGEEDKFSLKIRPPLGQEKIIVYASSAPLGEIKVKPLKNDLLAVEHSEKETGILSRSIAIHAWGGNEENSDTQAVKEQSKPELHEAEFFEASWQIITQE